MTVNMDDIDGIIAISGINLRNKLGFDILNHIFGLKSGILIDDDVIWSTNVVFASTTQSGASGITILMISFLWSSILSTILTFKAIDSAPTDGAITHKTNTVFTHNITIAITITPIASVGVSAPYCS